MRWKMRISEFKERLEHINWLFDVDFYVDENESNYIIRDALMVYAVVGKKEGTLYGLQFDFISKNERKFKA